MPTRAEIESLARARERQAVVFIDAYWELYWTSPTYSEIGEAVGLSSKASVQRMLAKLVREGVLLARLQPPSSQRGVLYRSVL